MHPDVLMTIPRTRDRAPFDPSEWNKRFVNWTAGYVAQQALWNDMDGGQQIHMDPEAKTVGIGGVIDVTTSTVTITADTSITGTFSVTGNSTLTGTLHVTGAVDLDSTLNVDGAATLQTTLLVKGITTHEAHILLKNSAAGSAWTIDNTANSNGDLELLDDGNVVRARFGDSSSTHSLHLPLGPFGIGATPATAGTIRTENNTSWFAKSAAAANLRMIQVTTSDVVFVGDSTNAAETRIEGIFTSLYAGANERLRVNSTGVGFFAGTPVAQQTLGGASTDLATVITLANNIRTALRNFNLCN